MADSQLSQLSISAPLLDDEEDESKYIVSHSEEEESEEEGSEESEEEASEEDDDFEAPRKKRSSFQVLPVETKKPKIESPLKAEPEGKRSSQSSKESGNKKVLDMSTELTIAAKDDEEEILDIPTPVKSMGSRNPLRHSPIKDVEMVDYVASVESDSEVEQDDVERDDEEEEGNEEMEEEETVTIKDLANRTGGMVIPSLDRNSKTVFNFLKTKNRPFGITDLDRSLQDLNRGQINTSLEKLVDLELVKQNDKKVVWLNQDVFGDISNPPIKELEAAKCSASALSDQVDELTREVELIKKLPCDDYLSSNLTLLTAKLHEHRVSKEANKENSTGNINGGSSKPLDQLKAEFLFFKTVWRERRINVNDVIDDMMESMAKSTKKEKLCEELGIETDIVHKIDIKLL